MQQRMVALGLSGVIFIAGCGGSSSATTKGETSEEFVATLPDGSSMALTVDYDENNVWAGDYVVLATTGDHAFESGTFEGEVENGEINATARTLDGKTFQLSGVANGSSHLKLTRSDLPGDVLNFTPTPASSPLLSRGQASFHFGSPNVVYGLATIPTTPYLTLLGNSQYKGTFTFDQFTFPCDFYVYTNGETLLKVDMAPTNSITARFSNYRFADFGNKRVPSTRAVNTMFATAPYGPRATIDAAISVEAKP